MCVKGWNNLTWLREFRILFEVANELAAEATLRLSQVVIHCLALRCRAGHQLVQVVNHGELLEVRGELDLPLQCSLEHPIMDLLLTCNKEGTAGQFKGAREQLVELPLYFFWVIWASPYSGEQIAACCKRPNTPHRNSLLHRSCPNPSYMVRLLEWHHLLFLGWVPFTAL